LTVGHLDVGHLTVGHLTVGHLTVGQCGRSVKALSISLHRTEVFWIHNCGSKKQEKYLNYVHKNSKKSKPRKVEL